MLVMAIRSVFSYALSIICRLGSFDAITRLLNGLLPLSHPYHSNSKFIWWDERVDCVYALLWVVFRWVYMVEVY